MLCKGCTGTPDIKVTGPAAVSQDGMHTSQPSTSLRHFHRTNVCGSQMVCEESLNPLSTVLTKQPSIDSFEDNCMELASTAEPMLDVLEDWGTGSSKACGNATCTEAPSEQNIGSLVTEHSRFRAQLGQYYEMQSRISDQQNQTWQRLINLENRVLELNNQIRSKHFPSSERDTPSAGILEYTGLDPQCNVSEQEQQLGGRGSKLSSRGTKFMRQHASMEEDNAGGDYLHTASEKITEQIHDRLHSESGYKLKESMWDVMYLIGYGPLGRTSNTLLWFGCALNIVMQCLLCIIVTLWLAQPEFTTETVTSFQLWRKTANKNAVTKLCDLDETLASAHLQYNAYEEARKYLSTKSLFEGGPVLCETVVVLWTFSVCCVMREVVDFVLAVYHLHKSRLDIVFCIRPEGAVFTISEVTPARFALGMFSAAMQMSISLVLLVAGNVFLAQTTTVEDLVLNAVAMNFIMQVDEMIYQLVVPKNVKCLVRNLEQLPLPERPQWVPHAVPLRALFSLAVACITVAVCHTQLIIPHQQIMRGIIESLCYGT